MKNNLTIQINQKGKDNQVIDLNGNGCVYISMGNHTYYFDNSTNECIIERWEKGVDKPCDRPIWKNIFEMSAIEYINLQLNSSDELTNTV